MSSTNSPQDDRHVSQPAKRGARACVSCRKGKNKCVNDGTAPCQRCKANNQHCVFEAPTSSKAFDEERVERMERSIQTLTGTVETLVATLSSATRLPGYTAPGMLSVGPPAAPAAAVSGPLRLDPSFNARSPANPMTWDLEVPTNGIGPLLHQQHVYQPPLPPTIPQDLSASFASALPTLPGPHKRPRESKPEDRANLPPLPNYRAPPHPVSMYGIIPSTAPSSDDEDQLPTASLTAPLEALAQAASEAQVEMNPADPRGNNGDASGRRARKRRKPMPPPPNAFPDVVTRGLVSDACCRQVFDFFMSSCLPFWPILDPAYDTYESLRERSPWSINAIVMVGATRISDSSSEFRQAAEHGLEEAHGIARSSLFGPTVRLEGCQAMGIVAAWQTGNSPYMAAGHALRMSMELGLHRALGKLSEDAAERRVRSQAEQRSLVSSARIFLCLNWLDWILSTSSGRPLSMHEELVSPDKLQVFLRHPLSIVSDKFLVAHYELMACRNRIDAMSSAFGGRLDARALEFARRSARDLNAWWSKWDATLGTHLDSNSLERKRLECSLHTSLIFLWTSVLKDQSLTDGEHLPDGARELAVSARQSAQAVLETCDDANFRSALRCAPYEVFVDLSFACLLLLKLTRLFHDGVDMAQVVERADRLQSCFFELAGAQRFSMTIKIALDRFARQFGLQIPSHNTLASQSSTATAETSSASGVAATFGFSNTGILPFDVASLPNSDWVGADLFPEWIKGETSDQDWTFDSAWTDGIDRLFLPQWSTGVVESSAVEW
ncbi:hypothetical protein ACM66B_003552 [Microbotryomycetes sp. NB124-2]